MTEPSAAYRELSGIIARYATEEGEVATAIDCLFLSRRTAPSQPLHTAQWPCFALVAQGAKSLTLGQEVYDYGVGDYLVVALDLPVTSRTTVASPEAPLFGLGIAIRPERLKDLFQRVPPVPTASGDRARGVAVNQADEGLLGATLRLLKLLDAPRDIPALAPLIEQEILYRLLTGPCGAALTRIARTDSPGNRVAKAVAWLRENYTEQLRIEDLANRVGMSTSSLHHHFSAVTAMTPLEYQKHLRLREARRLMWVDRLDVGSAGYQVGYQSASQFSREYSRMFGLPPSRDREEAHGHQSTRLIDNNDSLSCDANGRFSLVTDSRVCAPYLSCAQSDCDSNSTPNGETRHKMPKSRGRGGSPGRRWRSIARRSNC